MSSAVAGSGLASLTSTRFTYFLTVPFAVLSIGALSRFNEPHLHRADDPKPLRGQIATTYRTIIKPGQLRHIIITTVLCALLLQMLLEFGPLWLVALAAPAFYGPRWAGLMSAVGLGGMLAGPAIRRPAIVMGTVIAVMLGSALALTTGDDPIVVITAQVLLALLLLAVSTVLTRQLHDQIPSALRAGVTSGVGTLTWIGFLPLAIAFGLLSKHSGIDGAAWLLVATTAATGASLLRLAAARHTATAAHTTQPLPSPAPVDLVQARN